MSVDRTACLAGFLQAVREELGLVLGDEDADTELDLLPDWDSLHLMRLVMLLERERGHAVPVADVLHARTLREIHELATSDTTGTR
ncbi:acyl carrier protein [Streptomyces sp. SID11233]|nr:acyl carrier protein [Streptomyces sp. SID11233]